eukprot:SAG22_NODE_1679_length_3824_cov_6.607785_1_plen_81_part_10
MPAEDGEDATELLASLGGGWWPARGRKRGGEGHPPGVYPAGGAARPLSGSAGGGSSCRRQPGPRQPQPAARAGHDTRYPSA